MSIDRLLSEAFLIPLFHQQKNDNFSQILFCRGEKKKSNFAVSHLFSAGTFRRTSVTGEKGKTFPLLLNFDQKVIEKKVVVWRVLASEQESQMPAIQLLRTHLSHYKRKVNAMDMTEHFTLFQSFQIRGSTKFMQFRNGDRHISRLRDGGMLGQMEWRQLFPLFASLHWIITHFFPLCSGKKGLYFHPDRTFYHNFRASKYLDHQTSCTSKTSMDVHYCYLLVKRSAGNSYHQSTMLGWSSFWHKTCFLRAANFH